MFTTRFQAWVRRLAMRAMSRLQALPVTPNQITVAGLVVTSLGALLVALDHPFYGGLVLLAAGAFDIMDGALARASNRSNQYGAFVDSVTDRYAEVVVMLSLLVLLQRRGVAWGPTLVLVALAGSLLVSYARARAQSLGFTCDGGLLARPERVILTVVGLLLVPLHIGGLLTVVWILAIFTNVTAVQRVVIVWRQARALTAESAAGAGIAVVGVQPPAPVAPAPPATTAPSAMSASLPAPAAPARKDRPGVEPAG
ncbi:MAG TPA: CDP-alcohol phosphatidyltransferase family protein [Candidatus Dormibacteraeota bacterium]|jgi:CDP-diacylglycerol--glycerol-3-phosphate 3-phosphatidyltransferase|nr:CDP-alcohol phosphatidyltransferase family protein [Candidatus Dormibacteraeota bacterium]